jgi:hypothetical protein
MNRQLCLQTTLRLRHLCVKRIFNLFPGQANKRIRPLMMLTAAVLITSGGNAIYKRRRHRRRRKSYEEIIVWHMHAPLDPHRAPSLTLCGSHFISSRSARAAVIICLPASPFLCVIRREICRQEKRRRLHPLLLLNLLLPRLQ